MPPRWLVRLLERLLPAERHDDLVGDLEELHRRRRDRYGPAVAHLLTLGEGGWLAVRFTVGRAGAALAGSGRGFSAVELRLALRLLRKQPVATLTSVLALGVGIGIVAGAFGVFHQALSSDLGWPGGDRWVTVEAWRTTAPGRAPLSLEHLRALRSEAPELAYVGGAATGEFNLVHGNGEVERVAGARVTPGTFRHLPYRPVVGRLLGPADGAAGAEPVALIRESLWARRFSRAPDVVGRVLTVAGTEHRIVGVLPDEAGYPSDGELWLPLPEATLGAATDGASVGTRLVAVLTAEGTPARAEAQAQQIADRIAAPGRGAEAVEVRVAPLGEIGASPTLYMGIALMMGVLLAVLLIIAGNVANLVVARTSRRAPELAVRTALGASRGRLVGQLFVESLLVGALAAGLGLALAAGVLDLYDRLLDELPFWVDLSLRPSTAAAVVVLTLLATGVTGVLPALRATGKAPGDALRGAGRGAGLRVGRLGGLMIAAEVALCVALLGTAALYARGFQRYVDPLFDLPDERVLSARLVLDTDAPPDSLVRVLDALRRSAASLPGVEAVALTSHLPRRSPWPEPLELEGREELVPTPVVFAGPGLFEVLEVSPVLGRGIEERDLEPDALPVAVVNRSFALARFGTTQVLGRRLRMAPHASGGGGGDGAPEAWRRIVGVVPDVMEVAGGDRAAGVYLPLAPRRFLDLAVRVPEDPVALTGALRRAVYDVDPTLDVSRVGRLDQLGGENGEALRFMSAAFSVVGLVTLLLSLAGVYAIVSLSVTRRTREIGVRVALGARPGRVLWAVLRRSGILVLGGAAVGALLGWQLSRLRIFVFAVPDDGWWLFPALAALMAVAGAVACWVPARRALAVQPVEALRADG